MPFTKTVFLSHSESRPECLTALGNFDGIHTAHKKLLESTVEISKELGLIPAVWFFDPPAGHSDKSHRQLSTLDEKLKMIEDCGIAVCFISDFSELRDMPYDRFVSEVLVSECNSKGVVCGFNFLFGKDALGKPEYLKRFFPNTCFTIEKITNSNASVSSTSIRELIKAGKITAANSLLGYEYSITSEITRGKTLGATLGFPTANQYVPAEKIIPKFGVYETVCQLDEKKYRAVTDVGIRPSAENLGEVRLESHLLGFSGNAYGKTLTVKFLRRIRDEIKFDSLEQLKSQIRADVLSVSQGK